MKITFIGDIMCEPLLMKAARRNDGTFYFEPVFSHVEKMFAESDFVVGNLETPLAGEEAGYTSTLFSFNAPDEFADAVKKAGIHLVSTANNHCLDRGEDGFFRTLEVLDKKGIAHTGTQLQASEDNVYYTDIENTKIAVIAYTYSLNYFDHGNVLQTEDEGCVNLLKPQMEYIYQAQTDFQVPTDTMISKATRLVGKALSSETKTKLKKMLHMTYNTPREDDYLHEESIAPYMDRMVKDIKIAKEKADVVLFYPHVGGQFNIEPGAFTKYVIKKAADAGVHCVISSHPHIIQKAEIIDGIPCFYSIGNFSMSPNSSYLLHEHLPEYGLAVHVYLQEKTIHDITFSILKIVEKKGKILTVYPVFEYANQLKKRSDLEQLRNDISQVYKTVIGCELCGEMIRKEYSFFLQAKD